ncbi:hypothetical protein LCGC14_2821740, partial [marine sediment metagenome]
AYRYWLNRPRAAASHWLSPDEIRDFLTTDVIEQESMVAAGFDGLQRGFDHDVFPGLRQYSEVDFQL